MILEDSATGAVAVALDQPINGGVSCQSLWVGTGGDVAVQFAANGPVVVYKSVPAGRLRVRAYQVNSANTTAQNLLAEYY